MLVRILVCALIVVVLIGGIRVAEKRLQTRSTKTTKVKRRGNEGPDSGAVEHAADADAD